MSVACFKVGIYQVVFFILVVELNVLVSGIVVVEGVIFFFLIHGKMSFWWRLFKCKSYFGLFFGFLLIINLSLTVRANLNKFPIISYWLSIRTSFHVWLFYNFHFNYCVTFIFSLHFSQILLSFFLRFLSKIFLYFFILHLNSSFSSYSILFWSISKFLI